MEINLLLRSVIGGMAMAAPIGAVNILCIKNVLTQGVRHGIVTGLGATVGDIIFAFIAAISVTVVIDFIVSFFSTLQIIMGILLFAFGVFAMWHRTEPTTKKLPAKIPPASHYLKGFSMSFFLTISNPAAFISMLLIASAIGITSKGGITVSVATFLVGITIGAIIWWAFICTISSLVGRHMPEKILKYVNILSGFLFIVLGSLVFGHGILSQQEGFSPLLEAPKTTISFYQP